MIEVFRENDIGSTLARDRTRVLGISDSVTSHKVVSVKRWHEVWSPDDVSAFKVVADVFSGEPRAEVMINDRSGHPRNIAAAQGRCTSPGGNWNRSHHASTQA